MNMTTSEAIEWVEEHDDESAEQDSEQLPQVFRSLLGRQPDEDDMEEGLWSIVCQWVSDIT